jgi:hypothetical protein
MPRRGDDGIIYQKAKQLKQEMPYNPYNGSPFGITTWLKVGKVFIRVYQGVSGDLVQVDVSDNVFDA